MFYFERLILLFCIHPLVGPSVRLMRKSHQLGSSGEPHTRCSHEVPWAAGSFGERESQKMQVTQLGQQHTGAVVFYKQNF